MIFKLKTYDDFDNIAPNIDSVYSLEPTSSNVYPQSMF